MTFIPPHIQADPELMSAFTAGTTYMYAATQQAITDAHKYQHARLLIVAGLVRDAYEAAEGAA